MNELDFLEIINNKLTVNNFLGDDCAFLDDLGIFITHDTLVEDVHFSMYTISPYQLGKKSVSVNLSDLAAALSQPEYITVSLSMPDNIKPSFVEEFYRGVNDICNEYNVKVAGGDLTAAKKITVSICAIGKKISPFISSRSNAKKGDYVVVTGFHGSSSAGLYALSNFLYSDKKLLSSHLEPIPRLIESKHLIEIINDNIAVMDSSDGLVDALYKISSNSKHCIEADINKVPVQKEMIDFCNYNELDYKKFVKWGGEDYELVACVPEETYLKLDKSLFTCIGRVLNKDTVPYVTLKDGNKNEKITRDIVIANVYSHFNVL